MEYYAGIKRKGNVVRSEGNKREGLKERSKSEIEGTESGMQKIKREALWVYREKEGVNDVETVVKK